MLSTTVTGDARIEVVVDGRIEADDLESLRRTFEDEARLHGPVRMLATVVRFGGITAPALREDLRSIGLTRIIERYAVVTDIGWLRAGAKAEFALLPIEGRVFADRAEALAWLEG